MLLCLVLVLNHYKISLTEKSYFGNACISSWEITPWNFWELEGNPGWVQQLHPLETCFNNYGVTCLNVTIKTESVCIKTRWPKHSSPA